MRGAKCNGMACHLVLDIETIPDPELPRLDDSDKVPPPPFNQIVTLGCMLLDDYAKRLGCVGEGEARGAGAGRFRSVAREDEAYGGDLEWALIRHARDHEPRTTPRRRDALVVQRSQHALPVLDRRPLRPDGFPRRLRRSEERAARRLRKAHRLSWEGGRRRVAGRADGARGQARRSERLLPLQRRADRGDLPARRAAPRGLRSQTIPRGLRGGLLAFIDAEPRIAPVANAIDRARFLLEAA